MEEKIYAVPEAEVVMLEESTGFVIASVTLEDTGDEGWTGYY